MKKLLTLLLALLMTFSLCSTAFAADVEEEVVEEEPVVAVVQKVCKLYGTSARIYTGIGKAQWIHIAPDSVNVNYPPPSIQMIDYSGDEVWLQPINICVLTHWYVGANVKYVNILGGSGAVTVTHTDN